MRQAHFGLKSGSRDFGVGQKPSRQFVACAAEESTATLNQAARELCLRRLAASESKLSTYFHVQIVSAFMAALAAAHVLYDVVPTSFTLALAGKNSDGYCDNLCSLMEHLCEVTFCTT
jgi:hypothetical protein